MSKIKGFATALIVSALSFFGSAYAATLTITSLQDAMVPPAGSLRAAVAAAQDGDEIVFADALKGQTINLVSQITISTSVSIVGPTERITLSGGWNGNGSGNGGSGNGIFKINASGKTIALSNLNLINSYGTDDKENRALYVPAVSSLLVTDCSFSNNYCTRNGGAVRLDSNVVSAKFVRCLFADNLIDSPSGNDGGGAIFSEQSASYFLFVDGCSFRRNCAIRKESADGGGSIKSSSTATVVIANSEFSDGMTSASSGGAIKKHSGGSLYVVNSTFRGNYIYGDSWGPAIDARGPTYFANCTFAGNMVGDSQGTSGTIYLSGPKGVVNTAFAYNWRNAIGSPYTEDTNSSGGLSAGQMRGVVVNGKKQLTTSGTQTDLTLATTLAGISAATKLFAAYEPISSIVYPEASGIATVELNEKVFIPSLLEDGSLARVVAIDPEGELVSGGSLVKVSSDYLNCVFSEDGGTNWTVLYGDATLATELITADQRGVPYPIVAGVMQVPIGAACVKPKTINEQAAELEPGDWIAAPLTGNPEDIVNLGEPFTYTYGNETFTMANTPARASMTEAGHASVNGVTFPGWEVRNLDVSGGWNGGDASYFGKAGMDGTDYGCIMDGGWSREASGDATFHIGAIQGCSKLVPGELYLVQVIVHNGRNDTECAKTVSEVTTGKTLTFGSTDPASEWYYGGTFVHLFRAPSNGEYSFTLNYPADYAQYNAIQVRHVLRPVEPSIGSVTANVIDFSTEVVLSDVEKGTDETGAITAASYDVYAYETSNPTEIETVVPAASGATTSFTFDNLVSGRSYNYRIFIVNDANVTSVTRKVSFVCGWKAGAMSALGDTIETRGKLLYAYTHGTSGTLTVNTVPFERCEYDLTGAKFSISPGFTGRWNTDLGTEGASGDYGAMLAGAWNFNENTESTRTITLTGLTEGNTYLVQIVAHSGSANQQDMTVSVEGTAPQCLCSCNGAEYKYGASIVGVFTADGTSKNLTITYAGGKMRPFNAIQVRDVTPRTIAEQAAELAPGEWLVAPMTGDPSDIVTLGTLAKKGDTPLTYAPYEITGDASVSNVSFLANSILEGIANMTFDMWSNSKATQDSLGTCGCTGAYGQLMANAFIGNAGSRHEATDMRTIKLNGLTGGQTYLFQGVIHDGNNPMRQVSVGGKTITYGGTSAADDWYYGGTFVHVFTATDTTYDIMLDFEYGVSHMNAMQLREVTIDDPEQRTISEQAADLAAAFVAGTSSEQWLGLPMTGSPDDIVTTGTVVFAQALSKTGGGSDASVNNVVFAGSQDGVTFSGQTIATEDNGFVYNDEHETSTVYGKMLNEAWKSGSTGHTVPFTLNGLTSGHNYIVQMVVYHGNQKGNSVTAGGKTICYASDSSGDWFYGGTFVHVFTATDSTYTFNVAYTQNDMYNMLQVRDLTPATPEPESPYEVTGDPETIFDGDYVVYVWTNSAQTGTLTIPSTISADYLLVGGGGAGGFCRGGGGGGGGVVYQTAQTLLSGTYTIAVGAGGVPDTWPDHYSTESGHDDPYKYSGESTAGTDGGRSAITIEGTVVGEALGGGGGGTFISGQDPAYTQYGKSGEGRTGANAGGSANMAGSTAALDASGFAGGAAWSQDGASGGGGGAGANGVAASANDHSGNGGDGVECSITGESVFYGGGGGAGVYSGTAGVGGFGGGGNGGNVNTSPGCTAGVNGLGGGGGGASGAGNKWVATVGAPGGSGTVIVRLPLDPSSQPVPPAIGSLSADVSETSATITLSDVVIGTDETGATPASSYNVYAYTGAGPATDPVVEDEDDTTASFTLTDLDPGTYTYSVYIENNEGVSSATNTVEFTVTGPFVPPTDPSGEWTAAPLQLDGQPFSKEGKQIFAVMSNDGNNDVNTTMGITFNTINQLTDYADYFTLTPSMTSRKDNRGDEGKGGTDTDFGGMLKRCWEGNYSQTATFAFKGLKPGGVYLAQFFEHETSPNTVKGITSPDGTVKAYYGNRSGIEGDWTYGGVLSGLFTATNTVHELQIKFLDPGSYQLNAIQLREIVEPESPYEVTGDPEMIFDGDYVVYVWTNSAQTGTLTIPSAVSADYLLVGGGGAGGFCRGGGGGGGGVVYREAQTLASGTYTIAVGAGGVPDAFTVSGSCHQQGRTTEGANGQSSVLSRATTVVGEAFGGGGGGNFDSGKNETVNSGLGYETGVRNVATGGGSAGQSTVSAAGYADMGFAGGAAFAENADWASGGGGGAGAVGVTPTAKNRSGDGGAGVTSTITGESVCYGGGGGGGVYGDNNGRNNAPGEGGAGGGGHGGSTENANLTAGVDGLGGGGGGASGFNNLWENCGGAPGGSGTVIIRLPLNPSSQPVPPAIGGISAAAEGTTATINLSGIVMGTDSTGETAATSYTVFAYEGDDPTAATERAKDQSSASASFQVANLAAGAHVYHVYIENNQGVSSATNTVNFNIVLSINEQAAALQAGDWLAAPMSGSPNDIVNLGTLVRACAPYEITGDADDHAISFSVNLGNVAGGDVGSLVVSIGTKPGENTYKDSGFGTTSSYGKIMGNAWYGSSGAQTFTYRNLTPGTTYLVQFIVHDGREQQWTRTATVATDPTKSVQYGSAADGDWYYGGTLIHVFTAISAEYAFNLNFSSDSQINAIQLRDVTPKKTIAEQAEALQPGEWLAAPLTGDPSDILTLGEPITYTVGNETYTNAYAAGAGSMNEAGHASVGGVAFANGSYKNLHAPGRAVTDDDSSYFGTCGTTGDYARLMGAAYYTDDNFSQVTFSIANRTLQGGEYPALEVGEKYIVQLFFHSGRTANDEYLGTVTADADKTVRYGAVNEGDDWYYGGTLVHVFTAMETSYSFTLNYTGRYAIYNAFQIRKLAAEPTPVYTLTIPAHDHLSVESVTTNSVPVEGVAGAYSIVSNTEVTVTFVAASGYELDDNDGVVTKTIGAAYTFVDDDYPAVKELPKSTIGKQAADLAAAFLAGTSSEQWLGLPMTGSPDDIVTTGTVVFAQALSKSGGGSDASVNNVVFSGSQNGVTFSGQTIATVDDGFVYNGDHATSDVYGKMLNEAWKSGESGHTVPFTLNGLISGHSYIVQMVVYHGSKHNNTVTAGGKTICYSSNSSGDWFYGGTFIHVFTATDSTYTFNVAYTQNDMYNMLQVRDVTPVAPPPESPYTVTGDPETIIDGDYIVYVWTNAAQTGTLTIPSNVSADYLLVGGGGAGGFCRGGGGGGGGVVYGAAQTLAAGTYTITVGAGGTPDAHPKVSSPSCYQLGASSATTCGGNSTIVGGMSFTAYGGGGGGNYNDASGSYQYNCGLDGASGGGSAGNKGTSGSVVVPQGIEGQGHGGGVTYGTGDCGSGGGGAGTAGSNGSSSAAGNGGDGVECAITGKSVYYGGGGGGGCYEDRTPGTGGLGGGGNGGWKKNANQGMTPGEDGLGGGGGGASGSGNNYDYCGGAPGGSGTVIVRLPLDPSSQAIRPAFALATPAVSGTSATITLNNVVIGTDESGATQATAYDVFTYTGSDPTAATNVTEDADGNTANFTLTDVAYGDQTYYVYIVNDQNVTSETATASFTIVDTRPLEERIADMRAGDWLGMPLTGEAADVLTNGTLVTVNDDKGNPYQFSYGRTNNGNAYTTDETVNNVPAIERTDGFGVRDSGSLNWTGHQGEGAGDCGTTGQYALYMSKFFKCSRSNTDVTISCTVPAAGTYLVQMFVHYQSDNYLNQYVSVVGNSDVKIPYTAASGTPGYYGGTLVHVFEMSGAGTYEFSLHYDKEVICNYIQVRDVSAMIPQEPRLPSITAANVLVEGDCAQVTITGVDMGTDEDGYLATSYDVYASVDGATATLVAEDQSEATAMFLLSGLSQGEHDVGVYIVTDKGGTSEELPVEVTIVSAPAYFFPEGNWEALQLSKEATEIRTFGETVCALACSAGNNGRLYTVNGLKYHDTQRSNVSWGDWQLVNWADFEPALNSDKDSFGGEDVPTISGEDMAFQTVCRRAWLSENGSRMTTDFTMTLKQLEPGARYVVQLTAHNGSDNYGGKGQTMTAPDGVATITLGDADTTGTWRYGGTLIGTFVASNTTHAFRFTYGPDARYYQVNSLQLRKTGAAPAVVPDYPTLGGTSVAVSRGNATLTVSGLDAGVTDGACDIYYAIAEEGQAFGAYTRGAQNVTDASASFALGNTEEGKSYVYSVYAVNPATKLASLKTSGKFRIDANPGIPKEMTVGPVIRPGLVQAKFASGVLFDSGVQPPLVSNLLTQTTYASSLDYTYGALMAHQSCADENAKVLNSYSASQWNWDATYTVFAYEGEIYLREGQRLVIFGRFDDGEAAVVDGVTLLAQGNRSGHNDDPETRWVVYEPAESGWYPINAWVWDYTGGKNVMIPPSALAYNLAGLTSNTDQNRDQWKPLEDTDGKGSFLRFKEAKTLMTLGVPTTNGVDVTINAAFDDLPFPAKFVVYANGSQDGGLDPANWENIFEIANIASGDTAAANYTVKGLAAYPFVRFAIVAENSISTAERCQNFYQMSCVVGFDSDGLAVLIADPSFTTSEGTFNIVVAAMGGASSVGFVYEIATDPSFANVIKSGSLDGITVAGTYGVNVTDLTEAGTYYIRVKPTADGVDGDWIVANPVTPRIVGTLRINEIMASNGSILKTKNGGEDLDWIEIYNGTDEEVDLAGWYLSDNFEKGQAKWKVIEGNGTIPVHGYKIIWCDKDYTNWAADEAHTAIGLSTSGETVFLAKPDGTVVDTVTFGTQMKEISYGVGKMPGASETSMVFFSVPTPGAENGEFGAGPMTPSVTFSVPHGYKTAPIDVTITCADDPAAAIYYTLDGTQPTASNGTRYTEPLHITSTTILRAGVPQENSVLQVDSSATYIYLDDVLAQGRMGDGAASETARLQTPSEKFPVTGTLPTGQVNKHAMRYGMIQSIVNGPDRERILRGFTNTVATLSIVMDPELLFGDEDGIYVNSRKYMADGAAGERPMLLEQIDPVNGAVNEFSVPGGLRLRGAGSLTESNPKHALRFFFRGKYGMAKLNFPLFGDEGADEFSKVDLRCSQNYSWSMENSDYETFIHEVFSRDSQRDLGQPYTRSRYYNLFINGHYWGLYQTQERGDDDFAETYLGGSAEQYDCIKTSSNDAFHYNTQASSGTDAAWKALQGLAYNGFSGDYVGNYNQALGLNADGTRNPEYPILLNPENLMAYVTIAHFVCDADGPVSCGNGGLNNLYANRYRIDGASDMDGFWFLRHDAEYTLGVTNSNDAIFSPHTQYWSDPTALGTVGTDLIDNQGKAVDGQRYRGEDPAEKGENRSYGDFGPYQLHWELAKNPVYKRAFADYFYKNYLKEGGAMTVPVAKRRFEARMAEIDDVVVSEAARWSRSESQPMSREKWLAACQSCLDFIDARTPVLKAAYQARGWYPMLDAPLAFVDGVETDGLLRRKGETVTFSVTNDTTATIIYTIDGTDPADSATAITNATLVLGDLPVTVLVRAVKDDEVSALTEITFRADDGYTFYFNGEYTGDQTINPTGKECVVVFEDAEIAGRLVLPDGVKAYLCPTNGTANTVAGIVGEGAHLTLKDFDGQNGKVSLTGADTLIAISNLVVKSGTLDLTSTGVTATKTPVVNVLGHVKQDGGVINLNTSAVDDDLQVYGIYVANKDPKDSAGEKMKIIYAEFNGGTFNATVGGWKSAALYIDKGSVEATFNEGSTNNVELVGPEARFVNASGDLNLKGGEFSVTMPETYTSLTNARVFKSDKKIKIKGGHYVVDVPASGSEIFSTSYNGKDDESSITIDGGTFELVSDDDCFNADHHITVNDGLFYAVSSNNDVFDSNGDMTINGGTIMAYAQAAGHEAFDVDPVLTEDFGIPHVLTINGGTIFATGGNNSAWPENLTTGSGVTLLKLQDADVSTYSGKYLTLPGSAVTTTALLPEFSGEGSILATCLGLDAPTTSDTEPEEGDQNFHDLYIVLNEGMDQTGLRFYEIYGSTTGDGDTGEYIILTNVSDKAINLAGVKVNLEKLADYNASGIDASKCCFTLTGGTLAAGEAIRLDQATYWSGSKKKITNGDLHIVIFDATGATVQVGETSFSLYAPETDGGGASLIAKRFDNETPMTATTDDWGSSYPSVGSVDAVVTEQSVTITLSDVSFGNGGSSYDVYLVIDGGTAQQVGEGETDTTFTYTMNDLEPGDHSYSVYIENDQHIRTQATKEKSFTVNAPEPDIFPEGNWIAKAMTRYAAEIVTDGTKVYALASSAGNNGRIYTANGVEYYDAKYDDADWGDKNLYRWISLAPVKMASGSDDFDGEDAPTVSGEDMGFYTLCKRAWYYSGSDDSGAFTMTLKDLVPGAKYVVQLTVHNHSSNSDRKHPDGTMTAPDEVSTIQYGPLTEETDDPNRYGGTLIGTFVASNTTHVFEFTYTPVKYYQMNSIQLRMLEDAPEAPRPEYPTIDIVAPVVNGDTAKLVVSGIDAGIEGGTYAIYYAVEEAGTPRDEYTYKLAAKNQTASMYTIPLTDLSAGVDYVYSVYVANAAHLASSKAEGSMDDVCEIEEIEPTGDAATDTQAIQAAIDLAANLYPAGTVPLGEGVFVLNAELMVTGGVTLVGRGWEETVLLQTAVNARVMTIDEDATVADLTLTGGETASGVDGAGAWIESGTLSHCCVSNNVAGGNGGGVSGGNLMGDVTIETCLIADNMAAGNGGGVYVAAADADESASFVIKNTTIAGNEANVGGGISSDFAALALINDIVADNTATSDYDLALDDKVVDSVAANSATDLFGSGTAIGTGSVVGSPAFSTTAGDYHLLAGSAAIGLAAWSEDMPVDLDGKVRESWSPDAGCYERSALHVGEPTVSSASESALIALKLESIGADATTAEVTLAWGADPEDLASSVVIATAAEGETVDYLLEGLEKNTTYYYALTVRNNALPPETLTTATNSFATAEIAEVLGMYESYPTDPEAVPEGYVVTFIASDTVNPYYVVAADGFTYPVETTITNDATGVAEVYHYRNEADFLANASARIGEDYYLFLSDAVDASVSGDTIEVIRDNNFVGKTMIIDHPLTIEGSNHTVKVAHPFVAESGYVDLNCTTNVKTIFRVKTGGDVVLRDMTVMGGGEYLPAKEDGSEDPGSNNAMIEAIVVSDGNNNGDRAHGFLEMENVTVTRSQGALLVGTEAKVHINRCQLVRNCRNCAGGIYNHGTVVMENSSLSENRSLAPGGGGGGASENQGVMYINNCVICNNSSTEVGGAINNYSFDQGVKLYLMNSTVSGNFTTWRDALKGERPGGGVGLRAAHDYGEFYAVNDLVCNNYYYDPATGEVTVSDIGLYGDHTTNEIAYCVFGSYDDYEYEHETYKEGNVEVTEDSLVFLDEYAAKRVYANAKDTTAEINGARLYSDPEQPLARYAPIDPEGPAATMGENGVTTYFDASGWKTGDIKMSYMTKGGEMTALGELTAATEDDLVTTFYESAIVPNTVEREIGMVGASGWADEDVQFYTLKLIARPLNGQVGNITLYGDTYKSGTEVTITATPDPKCSFIGWFDENDELVSDHASYTLVMTQDTLLRAKFTEPMWTYRFVNIECEQAADTHGKFPLEVLTNWLAQAFSDICPDGRVTEENIGLLEERLNAPDTENGLNHVWMNYVLGELLPGDSNGRIWIRADQTRDPESLRFRIQEFAPVKDCGFTVRYRLNVKAAEAADYVRSGSYETSGSFDDKFKVWQNVHRVVDMIFIPDGYALSEEYVTTVNTAGVMKVESEKKVEILASPWAGFSPTGNPAVKAEDYVKAACLSENDVLYVYDRENTNYVAWTVRADGTWSPVATYLVANGGVTRSDDATRTNAIPRGAGAWLERHDVTKPIYLYGQVDGSPVTTRLESGFSLIGSPLAAPFDVRTLLEPTTKGVYGDHIAIPTDAAPINSYFIEGKGWSVQTNVIETIVNPRTGAQSKLVTPVWTTDEELLTVPAGHGFWYYNKDDARDFGWASAAE